MKENVYEVWVCDNLDPCLHIKGAHAGDYMCYIYNEVSLEFKPLSLNSRLKLVR